MKFISFILLIVLMSSCDDNKNWTEFQGKGLPTTDNSYQALEFV